MGRAINNYSGAEQSIAKAIENEFTTTCRGQLENATDTAEKCAEKIGQLVEHLYDAGVVDTDFVETFIGFGVTVQPDD